MKIPPRPTPHSITTIIQLDAGIPEEITEMMLDEQFLSEHRVFNQEWVQAIMSEFGCRIKQFESLNDDKTYIVVSKISEKLPDVINFDDYCHWILEPCDKTIHDYVLFQKHPPFRKLLF